MVTQIFIHKQGVQGGGVKAGEEHAHHNQQVDLLGLNPFGQVAVVVLEAVAVYLSGAEKS